MSSTPWPCRPFDTRIQNFAISFSLIHSSCETSFRQLFFVPQNCHPTLYIRFSCGFSPPP
jgi:hypothetical protein